MKFEDTVEGETYVYSYDSQTWILKMRYKLSKEIYPGHLQLKKDFIPGKGNFAFCGDFEIATASQRTHLEACIKANKYVPFEEINKEQEIILW